jgi:hypothetical protein
MLFAQRTASWTSFAGGLGAVLLPKCPLCLGAYGSALGALGLSPAVYRQAVEPFLACAVVMSFGLVSVLALRRRDVLVPAVSALGVVLVLIGRLALEQTAITTAGAALLVAAALWSAARCRSAHARAADSACPRPL